MRQSSVLFSAAGLALVLLSGCANEAKSERDIFGTGRTEAHGGATDVEDYERFSTARPGSPGGAFVRQKDIEEGLYDNANPEQFQEFLNLRCNVLGTALTKLGSDKPELVELGYSDIKFVEDRDQERREQLKRSGVPEAQWSGFIIPRYIAVELSKPKAKHDREWLARRGRLLVASQHFERLSTEFWEQGVVAMLREGADGREVLAANMVRRLALADVNFVRLAQQTLQHAVSDEAIPMLVAAAHVDLAKNRGTFPKYVAETLVLIGSRAVPEVLTVWKDEKGGFRPTSDNNWQVRRYLVPALGNLGDTNATPVLLQDLKTKRFESEDTDFLYTSVLITALGHLRDKTASQQIVDVWKSYRAKDDHSLNRIAREALFRITGRNYDSPEAFKG